MLGSTGTSIYQPTSLNISFLGCTPGQGRGQTSAGYDICSACTDGMCGY